MKCDYCDSPVELSNGLKLYGRKDLENKSFWCCSHCDAYVGCHPGTRKPLGRLANPELRHWKRMAHTKFDPLWMRKIHRDNCGKGKARRSGYKWLSSQLGIERDNCHIGMFDIDTCKRVVEICETVRC